MKVKVLELDADPLVGGGGRDEPLAGQVGPVRVARLVQVQQLPGGFHIPAVVDTVI